MTVTDHDALRQSAGLYALGALSPEDRETFEAHLATCAECAADVRMFSSVTQALPYAVPQIDPPAELRSRVLGAVGALDARERVPAVVVPRARPAFVVAGWLSAAALLVLTIGLSTYAVGLRRRVSGLEVQLQDAVNRLDRSEQQVAVATRIAEGAQVRMAVLTAPDLTQVTLAGQPPAPGATGRAFFSRSRGLVFAAADLPALPPGRTYQLWYLQPTPAAPVSAGLLQPDAAGRATATFDAPPDVQRPAGLAVSIEPEGGVPAPTGDLYLVGTVARTF